MYPWLRAGWSTRLGGVSAAYGGSSLNLGWRPDDEDAHVRHNRELFGREVWASEGLSPATLVTVRQVHSDVIAVVGTGTGSLATEGGRATLEADGLVTDLPGLLLGIQVADCVPVLIADVKQRTVGAVHAGWRGTAAGIVRTGVRRMQETYGSDPGDMVAAIGPSIGPCCYEVGDEVMKSFLDRLPHAESLFRQVPGADVSSSGVHLDLWEANRRQLVDAGVPASAIQLLGECSACSRTETGERKYFSHRAEAGRTGRMMGAVGIIR